MNIFEKLLGANWKTTLFGTIATVSLFIVTSPDLVSGVLGESWTKRIFSFASLITGFLAFRNAKDKAVTGGTTMQTKTGATAAPGTQSLVDATLKASAESGEQLTSEERHAANTVKI